MDIDDLDIYHDLDEFKSNEEKKTNEYVELDKKYNDAIKTIEILKNENKDIKKKLKIMEINFQSLLDTAKTEIKRKDKMIHDLNKEKDDICFRRKRPKTEDSEIHGNYQSHSFNNLRSIPNKDKKNYSTPCSSVRSNEGNKFKNDEHDNHFESNKRSQFQVNKEKKNVPCESLNKNQFLNTKKHHIGSSNHTELGDEKKIHSRSLSTQRHNATANRHQEKKNINTSKNSSNFSESHSEKHRPIVQPTNENHCKYKNDTIKHFNAKPQNGLLTTNASKYKNSSFPVIAEASSTISDLNYTVNENFDNLRKADNGIATPIKTLCSTENAKCEMSFTLQSQLCETNVLPLSISPESTSTYVDNINIKECSGNQRELIYKNIEENTILQKRNDLQLDDNHNMGEIPGVFSIKESNAKTNFCHKSIENGIEMLDDTKNFHLKKNSVKETSDLSRLMGAPSSSFVIKNIENEIFKEVTTLANIENIQVKEYFNKNENNNFENLLQSKKKCKNEKDFLESCFKDTEHSPQTDNAKCVMKKLLSNESNCTSTAINDFSCPQDINEISLESCVVIKNDLNMKDKAYTNRNIVNKEFNCNHVSNDSEEMNLSNDKGINNNNKKDMRGATNAFFNNGKNVYSTMTKCINSFQPGNLDKNSGKDRPRSEHQKSLLFQSEIGSKPIFKDSCNKTSLGASKDNSQTMIDCKTAEAGMSVKDNVQNEIINNLSQIKESDSGLKYLQKQTEQSLQLKSNCFESCEENNCENIKSNEISIEYNPSKNTEDAVGIITSINQTMQNLCSNEKHTGSKNSLNSSKPQLIRNINKPKIQNIHRRIVDTSSDEEKLKNDHENKPNPSAKKSKHFKKSIDSGKIVPNSDINFQFNNTPYEVYPSPIHPIFQSEATSDVYSFLPTLPVNTSQDEVDKRLKNLFQSPTHESIAAPLEYDQTNLTIDETNENNSIGLDSTLQKCVNPDLSNSNTSNSDSKCISLGSSDYRFEKISDNAVKLYITRKRFKKGNLKTLENTPG